MSKSPQLGNWAKSGALSRRMSLPVLARPDSELDRPPDVGLPCIIRHQQQWMTQVAISENSIGQTPFGTAQSPGAKGDIAADLEAIAKRLEQVRRNIGQVIFGQEQ